MRCSNSVWTAVRLVGVVCLLSFNPLANGQTCELWNKQPELCSRFPGYHGEQVYIYVPEGSTLSAQASYVAAAVNVLGSFGQTYGDTGNYCNNRYLMLACATHLRPCETVPSTTNDGETVAVPLLIPRQPCRSLCLEYRSEKCIALTDSLDIPIGNGLYYPPGNIAPPVSCFNETEFGVPYFLEGNVTVPLDRFSLHDLPEEMAGMENFTLSCNEMSAESMELSCEYPLALDADNQRCSFKCPLPSYSDEQYDNIKVLQLTFGWLSWVGSLLVALSYGLHPSLRSFPANLILMTALGTNIATFAIILPTFATHETTWCGIDGSYIFPSVYAGVDEIVMTFNTNELLAKSHLCSFQGFVLMFGFLSTTMWWVIISFNMFLTVYFGKKLPTSRMWVVGLQVTFHVVGWVVPFVLTLIPTAADRMAFGPGDTLYVLFPSSFLLQPSSCSSSFRPSFSSSCILLVLSSPSHELHPHHQQKQLFRVLRRRQRVLHHLLGSSCGHRPSCRPGPLRGSHRAHPPLGHCLGRGEEGVHDVLSLGSLHPHLHDGVHLHLRVHPSSGHQLGNHRGWLLCLLFVFVAVRFGGLFFG
ncbi:Nuclear receptor ROR-alpha A-like, variant 2 [Balamuthia mandrillaris]